MTSMTLKLNRDRAACSIAFMKQMEKTWAEAEKFQQATAELNAAAQTATSIDDVMPAFGQVGQSCKSCHTDFRVKND